jgi:hypothetical protein
MKLREQDYHEIQAMHGIDVNIKDILEQSMALSKECYTGELDGEVIVMFGVSVFNQEKNLGCPWMLGSDKLAKVPKDIVSQGKRYVAEWLKEYKGLINFVDTRNSRSIRWLKRIGFYIHEPMEMGVMMLPFHPFSQFRREE